MLMSKHFGQTFNSHLLLSTPTAIGWSDISVFVKTTSRSKFSSHQTKEIDISFFFAFIFFFHFLDIHFACALIRFYLFAFGGMESAHFHLCIWESAIFLILPNEKKKVFFFLFFSSFLPFSQFVILLWLKSQFGISSKIANQSCMESGVNNGFRGTEPTGSGPNSSQTPRTSRG